MRLMNHTWRFRADRSHCTRIETDRLHQDRTGAKQRLKTIEFHCECFKEHLNSQHSPRLLKLSSNEKKKGFSEISRAEIPVSPSSANTGSSEQSLCNNTHGSSVRSRFIMSKQTVRALSARVCRAKERERWNEDKGRCEEEWKGHPAQWSLKRGNIRCYDRRFV